MRRYFTILIMLLSFLSSLCQPAFAGITNIPQSSEDINRAIIDQARNEEVRQALDKAISKANEIFASEGSDPIKFQRVLGYLPRWDIVRMRIAMEALAERVHSLPLTTVQQDPVHFRGGANTIEFDKKSIEAQLQSILAVTTLLIVAMEEPDPNSVKKRSTPEEEFSIGTIIMGVLTLTDFILTFGFSIKVGVAVGVISNDIFSVLYSVILTAILGAIPFVALNGINNTIFFSIDARKKARQKALLNRFMNHLAKLNGTPIPRAVRNNYLNGDSAAISSLLCSHLLSDNRTMIRVGAAIDTQNREAVEELGHAPTNASTNRESGR